MLNVKGLEEDRVPFFPNAIQSEAARSPHLGRPIAKGVVNHLRRWPSELSTLFVIACLVMSLILVTFVMLIAAIFCTPAAKYKCELGGLVDQRAFNVYFVKEATQVWSRNEFCYIEAAAREHPEMNIHLINLIRTPSVRLNTSEVDLKAALAAGNPNICSADFSVDEFFSRSKLSSSAGDLSEELLLLAAKAYLLWNSPGIAMHPSAYCSLATINESLCKAGNRDCAPNVSAAIDLALDLQATQVHCQAFLGFLLRELSRNATTRVYSMKDALDRFCLRCHQLTSPPLPRLPRTSTCDCEKHALVSVSNVKRVTIVRTVNFNVAAFCAGPTTAPKCECSI